MEMNWSRWFHCESSFGLLLVPSQPGVFALAEEVVQAAGPQSRRMLAVFEVAEAEDLSRAMSRLFAAGSPWREKMAQVRVYVRYAIAPGLADRRAATAALKNWLSAQREVASQIFESKPSMAAEQKAVMGTAAMVHSGPEPQAPSPKTVAERAVDRVTHGIKLGKAIPAGF
jgi:acyl-CoA reductase-like NAD-dependent aldehyde dehydrogenase